MDEARYYGVDLGRYVLEESAESPGIRVVPARSTARRRRWRRGVQLLAVLGFVLAARSGALRWSVLVSVVASLASATLWLNLAKASAFSGAASRIVERAVTLSRLRGGLNYRDAVATCTVLVDGADAGKPISIRQLGVDVFLVAERALYHLDRFENGWRASAFADLAAKLLGDGAPLPVSRGGEAERRERAGLTRSAPWQQMAARRADIEAVILDPRLPTAAQIFVGLSIGQVVLCGAVRLVHAGPFGVAIGGLVCVLLDALLLDVVLLRSAKTRIAEQIRQHGGDFDA